MKEKVKYIGFYDLLDSKYKRNSCLSAVNKMNYIVDTITRTGRGVEIISPSWYIDRNVTYTPKQVISINKDITLIQAPSFRTKNKITGRVKCYFSMIWLFCYLLINVKCNEEIIVYHSLALIKPIRWAKKIKKFKCIYEVEEIYTDVGKHRRNKKINELKMIYNADKYIFSTELLNEKLNIRSKPYIISYGAYGVELKRENKLQDGKIHAVYAGTLDPIKGGAIKAVKVGEHLDENYHIHIIGFGNLEDKKALENLIKQTSEITKCAITYDGLYSGEEYIKFLQKCHIGFSTQTSDGTYNDTSFPSKVLSYLANGLRVVSIKIKVLECSKVGDLLYYYNGDDTKDIANTIKNIDFKSQYDSRERLRQLDREFISRLEYLMEV